MPVIGLKLDTIDAKRNKDNLTGEIKINSTPKIVSAKEIDVGAIAKKALAFGFEFITEYGPDVAKINVNGEVIYVNDERKAEILKGWKKDKKLPDDVGIEVLNHLFRHCLLKVSNIAEDLQLPPPLNFPLVKAKSEQQASYIG
jgi:hypothetical protein